MPLDLSGGFTRVQLEALWSSRVKEARQHYTAAAEKSKAVLEERTESLLPSADGAFAFRQSTRLEAAAFSEYRRTLEIFTRLVVHGKVPPPE